MINDLVNAFIKKANWGYPRSRNRYPPLKTYSPARWQDHSDGWSQGIEKYELTPDTPPPPKLPSKLTSKERAQKQLAVLLNYEKLTNKPAPNFILSLIDQLKRYGKELSEKQREVVIKMMGTRLIGENLMWFN